MSKIYRLHYRGHLKESYSQKDLQDAVKTCTENIRELQKQGRMLTAALYYHDRLLFLYYEAMGEDMVSESGEDVSATVAYPQDFLSALRPYLQVWPGQRADRLWVHMYHIYYHSIPKSPQDWKRAAVPQMRRGRIAFLHEDKLFGYICHHRAIVEEGLLTGDRYQSIALHENILFSYFEEPKTITNIRNQPDLDSQAIKEWIAADPESHFIHMPQGGGENFMFLPAFFALGAEDMSFEEPRALERRTI